MPIILFFLLLISTNSFADTKITALPDDPSPTADDLLLTVDDPGGTPANKKVTLTNMKTFMSPWTITGSDVYYNTGNVGVGTIAPVGLLNIYGTNLPADSSIVCNERSSSGSRGCVQSFIGASNGSADPIGDIKFFGNTSTEIAKINVLNGATGATGRILLSTNNGAGDLERMRVETTGNIGMGTQSPLAGLHVTAGVGGVDIAKFERVNGTRGFISANVSGGDPQLLFDFNNAGSQWALGHVSSDDSFRITDGSAIRTNGNDRFVINNGGNVGIGTTVISGASVGTLSRFYTAGGKSVMRLSNLAEPSVGPFLETYGIEARFATTTGTAIGGMLVHLQENDIARKVLNLSGQSDPFILNAASNGNIGIGTNAPVATVNIVSTDSFPEFRVDDNGVGDTSPFVVDQNGNVGVGTSIPTTWLQTIASSTMPSSSAANGALTVGGITNSTTYALDCGVLSPLGAWCRGTTAGGTSQKLAFQPIGGNLGIGTIDPSGALLHIPSTASQDLVRVDDNGIGDGSPFLIDQNGNVGVGTTLPVGGMVVMNGNVGIGTWIPSALLEVKGGGSGNVGIGTSIPPTALYVVGTGTFTTGLNIGIGTASPTRLCIANNTVSTCP